MKVVCQFTVAVCLVLISTHTSGQSFADKEDLYHQERIILFDENNVEIGYYIPNWKQGDCTYYSHSGEFLFKRSMVENLPNKDQWVDKKLSLPEKPGPRIPPLEKVL